MHRDYDRPRCDTGVDLGRLGYLVVGLFVATWLCSFTLWKTRRFEQRWSALLERT